FTFDEKAFTNERDKIRELETERQKLYANLVRWLKINFGEIFSASMHIKVLRVFVESVLRLQINAKQFSTTTQKLFVFDKHLLSIINLHKRVNGGL
ncbi:unnamed protein product, partial [Rotaria socialis]